MLLSVATSLLLGVSVGGLGREDLEYEVKAALLYKFVKYLEWPADRFPREDVPLVVGVFGRDPFGDVLDETLEGQWHGTHPLEAKRFRDLAEAATCHILYVPQAMAERQAEVLRAVEGASVVVVGESPGFAARGGVINLYIEKQNVRFEINPRAAKRERLKISASLLKLARIVENERD